MLGIKSDIYLEISSITNVRSIRIYIGTTLDYPTQFSMSGKVKVFGLQCSRASSRVSDHFTL